VTKDFKQLQYFSAVNQMVIAATNSHTPHWPTRMTYRAAHDTECCAGNINRAMPNYVIRMWMRPQDGGLAAVYYGPSELTTTVAGKKITVTEETDYPFRDSISFLIKTAVPVKFNFQFRIPEWCSNATIQVNGNDLRKTPKAGAFASVKKEFRDGDVVNLKLPMTVGVEDWFHGQSVCFVRGPLVYSLQIDEKRVAHSSDPDNIRAFMAGHDIQGFPEVEFLPQSDWRYGFNAAQKNNLSKIQVVESGMTDNPFLENQTPVRLEVPVCQLTDWGLPTDKDRSFLNEPSGLPVTNDEPAEDQQTTKLFVPYGATHLRLTTIPVVPARHADNSQN